MSGGTLPLKEIAERLNVSVGTVKSWKSRDAWGQPDRLQRLQRVATENATKQKQRRRRGQVDRNAIESIEANEELTEREKDFCIAFVSAPTEAQAAKLTGRYSTDGAARTAAWEMMKKPAVQEEIKRLKAIKRSMRLADADDVIEMHMRIAFADIRAFVEFGREEVQLMGPFGPLYEGKGKNKKPITKVVNSVRFKESAEVDGAVVSEVKQGKDGASVKLVDRQKSLAFLERYFEMNPMDRHKKEYDNKRLDLEREKLKVGNEEALEKLDGILSGVEKVMQDG